jgi:hypothetical protein
MIEKHIKIENNHMITVFLQEILKRKIGNGRDESI